MTPGLRYRNTSRSAVLPEFKKQVVLQEFPGFRRLYPQLNVQRGSPEGASCFTRFRKKINAQMKESPGPAVRTKKSTDT
jgi:hypothetical protein